ncbi:hypothetical protein UY3_16570 [Chelonia mydas]|uniref:Uncharacterized protein n=1 Tax=Chelonia mydas TaxID=8469 RepID=M7AME0_CHEMY|nr:hypothetical protein UY3_16570 [Chelonia mydas]
MACVSSRRTVHRSQGCISWGDPKRTGSTSFFKLQVQYGIVMRRGIWQHTAHERSFGSVAPETTTPTAAGAAPGQPHQPPLGQPLEHLRSIPQSAIPGSWLEQPRSAGPGSSPWAADWSNHGPQQLVLLPQAPPLQDLVTASYQLSPVCPPVPSVYGKEEGEMEPGLPVLTVACSFPDEALIPTSLSPPDDCHQYQEPMAGHPPTPGMNNGI